MSGVFIPIDTERLVNTILLLVRSCVHVSAVCTKVHSSFKLENGQLPSSLTIWSKPLPKSFHGGYGVPMNVMSVPIGIVATFMCVTTGLCQMHTVSLSTF